MGQAIAFYTLAAFILGFAVLVVSTKDTVHSVLFLVLDFLFVAALYVLLGAPFLAAIQVLVYAGGIGGGGVGDVWLQGEGGCGCWSCCCWTGESRSTYVIQRLRRCDCL